jgi:hypothetical protein
LWIVWKMRRAFTAKEALLLGYATAGSNFIFQMNRISLHLRSKLSGEVSEWPNEQAWKVCILARVSRVRIPPSPQVIVSNDIIFFFAILSNLLHYC